MTKQNSDSNHLTTLRVNRDINNAQELYEILSRIPKDKRENTNVILSLSNGKTLYLRHVVKIRWCELKEKKGEYNFVLKSYVPEEN